jgi:uncharacterized protein (UPF0147 family)
MKSSKAKRATTRYCWTIWKRCIDAIMALSERLSGSYVRAGRAARIYPKIRNDPRRYFHLIARAALYALGSRLSMRKG